VPGIRPVGCARLRRDIDDSSATRPAGVTEIIRFDHDSLTCNDATPGEILSRSTAIGWTSFLLEFVRCDVGRGEFATGATTNHRISLLVRGELGFVDKGYPLQG
jgi:hypothetical protein